MIVHNCDGTHIRSLLVNFIHAQWPSLLKLKPSFLQTVRTPIVKAIRGKKILEFFTEQDYHIWKQNNSTSGYQIRYFKGLGTSKKEDAQDTFRRLNELKIDYYYENKKCDDAILLAFEKDKNIKTKKPSKDSESQVSDDNEIEIKCSDRRKEWLSSYDKDVYIDSKISNVSYQDLINKELVHFSIYDNLRSIPSICDGLKPSQRKILYYMLKNNINKSIKVAQLSGYVSAETGYHHGEASLQQAIVGMAQNFVGSNNINLLFPDGNMGSRYMVGKDAASPRYIYTRLSEMSSLIFNNKDTPLLDFKNDDGIMIEPEWYLPIIPMILVNGCEGIGTGYSTFIPPYNPKDIINNLLRVLSDTDATPLKMTPYFKGFKGELVEDKTKSGSYITRGKWERLSDTQIKITELPIGMGVTIYKEFLESFIEGNTRKEKDEPKKKKKNNKILVLKDIQDKTKDENDGICFLVQFKDSECLDELINSGLLEKELKLTKTFGINNMYVFDQSLQITKYKSPEDILLDFYDLRIEYYGLRKDYIIKKLKHELKILENKKRFIDEYISGKLDINRKSADYILKLLEERKYNKFGSEITDDDTPSGQSYDYLTRMPIISMTKEKIEELDNQCKNKNKELKELMSKSPEDLWKNDLEELKKLF